MFEKTKKTKKIEKEIARLGIALLFIVGVLLWSYNEFQAIPNNLFLVIAAIFGSYMAMNIGANDVANNVGPAVGAKVMTLTTAILLAAIFEAGGALIAGGDVVGTIKKGIIDPSMFNTPSEFIWAMSAALFAAALWLNIATYFKAPVSTTHSIVGGVMGGGIAAAGFSIVSWGTMGKIAMSWVISPVLGGIIAAIFLYIIKDKIIHKENKLEAAKKFVPYLVSLMAWAFGTYLVLKGLKKVWPSIVKTFEFLPDTKKPTFAVALAVGLGLAVIVFLIVKPIISSTVNRLENNREAINKLFAIPLIFAAALLSFAHGANDVANAVGPLAAINDSIISGDIASKAMIPLWVMVIGALGIALGLLLYGPRLIKTVGGEITELDAMRAYSIAMASALTVIVASQLGLPVSTTHIAIGGVFGVGFLREYLSHKQRDLVLEEETKEVNELNKKIEDFSEKINKLEAEPEESRDFKEIAITQKELNIAQNRLIQINKDIENIEEANYVQRSFVSKIVAAWLITVPAAAVISALIFFIIRGMML
jgi:PiT family inorganic phosphate transporter